MDVFSYLDYKAFLIDLIKANARGYQTALAKAINCQAAYLIQVLKKKGDLTGDQALKATEFLGLNEESQDYFMLLINFSRSGSPELKSYYRDKIAKQLKGHTANSLLRRKI